MSNHFISLYKKNPQLSRIYKHFKNSPQKNTIKNENFTRIPKYSNRISRAHFSAFLSILNVKFPRAKVKIPNPRMKVITIKFHLNTNVHFLNHIFAIVALFKARRGGKRAKNKIKPSLNGIYSFDLYCRWN